MTAVGVITVIATIALGLLAAYAVYMWHAWKKEAYVHHEGKHRLAETTFNILGAVHRAAQKMDLANHKDAAAILLNELEEVKAGIELKRDETLH